MLKPCARLLVLLLVSFADGFFATAQIPDVSAKYAPPAPGVGHDYIGAVGKMASDTVNPLTGSVTFRINVPAPPTRGPAFAPALTYNSAGIVQYLGGPANEIGIMRTDPGSGPGWTFALPTLTYLTAIGTSDAAPGLSCNYTTSYVFRDNAGTAHSLPLSVFNNGDDEHCHQVSVFETRSGTSGDALLSSSITGSYPEGAVTVVDHSGTSYFFDHFIVSTASGPGGYYAFPSKIMDRNGNVTTITQGSDGSFSVSDPNGRVAAQASARSGTQTFTTSAWQGNASLVWTQANRVIPSMQSDATCQPQGSTPLPNGQASGNVYLLQSVTLPGNYTFNFEYDPTSGFLQKVTYPNGGFIRYTWGLNSRSEYVNWWYSPSGVACVLHRDFPAITKREVSFDGITIAQTQDFSYSTQWTTSSSPDTKQTSITSTDNARQSTGLGGGSTVTTYAYSGSGATDRWNERTISTSQGSTSRVTTKGWNYLNQLLCTTDLLDGSVLSGTVYGYTNGEISDVKSYDYGSLSNSSFCPAMLLSGNLDLSGLPAPTREVVTAYHTFSDSTLLSFPDSVKIFGSGSSTPASEIDFSYDEYATSGVQNIASHESSNVPRGNATTISRGGVSKHNWYDISGQIVATQDGRQNYTYFKYGDATYGVPPQTPTNAYVTEIDYPTTGNGTSHTARYGYDYSSGAMTFQMPEAANTDVFTMFTYSDPLGRLTLTIPPTGGGTQQISYHDSGAYQSVNAAPYINVTTQIGSGGTATSSFYTDGFGNLIRSDSAGASVYQTYDGFQRTMTSSNPTAGSASSALFSTYSYDVLGRLVGVALPDGNSTQRIYAGNVVYSIDPSSKGSATSFDSFGQIAAVTENAYASGVMCGIGCSTGYTTNYSYDTLGNLKQVVQHGASTESPRTRSFTYDSLSRLLTAANPETGTVCYGQWSNGQCINGYDGNGNLLAKTDNRGIVASFTYDALNRLTGKSYSANGRSEFFGYDGKNETGTSMGGPWTYDAVGRLTSTSDQIDTATLYAYDAMGRITEQKSCCNAQGNWDVDISADYDLASNLTDITYPDGRQITHQYDSAGRLSAVMEGTASTPGRSFLQNIQYFPDGSTASFSYGANGVTETRQKNSRLQICKDEIAVSGRLLSSRQYFYDSNNSPAHACADASQDNGNILHVMNGILTSAGGYGYDSHSYQYDSLSRLTRWDGTNTSGVPFVQSFIYDAFGNMASTLSDTFDTQNRYASARPCASLAPGGTSYDGNGNLQCFGTPNQDAAVMTWDAENRIQQFYSESFNNTPYPRAAYVYDAVGNRSRTDTYSTDIYAGTSSVTSNRRYVYFNGQQVADVTYNPASGASSWTDHVYANGEQVALVRANENALHFTGLASDGTVSRYAVLNPYEGFLINSGDMLVVRQRQTGSVGGSISVTTSEGGTSDALVDQDGQPSASDRILDSWHNRQIDLSSLSGQHLSNLLVGGNFNFGSGPFTIDFAEFAIARSSGDVWTFYNGGASYYLSFASGTALSQYPFPTQVATDSASTHYLVGDQVGTVKLELGSSGWPLWHGFFTPFGQQYDGDSTQNRYNFAGSENDPESGLNQMGARYYSGSTGRFMSPDPGWFLQANPNKPQTWNQYAYGLNNPVTNSDRTGLDCIKDNQDGTVSSNVGDCANENENAANHEYYVNCDGCTSGATGARLDTATGSLYLTDSNGNGLAGTTVQGFAAAQGVSTNVSVDASGVGTTTESGYGIPGAFQVSRFTNLPTIAGLSLSNPNAPSRPPFKSLREWFKALGSCMAADDSQGKIGPRFSGPQASSDSRTPNADLSVSSRAGRQMSPKVGTRGAAEGLDTTGAAASMTADINNCMGR